MKILVFILLLFSASYPLAQTAADDTSMKDVIEAEEQFKEQVKQIATEGGTLDMSTPLSTLLLLRDALDAEDYERAAEFLDVRYLPRELQDIEPETLLKHLRYVWSRQEILNVSLLSDHPDGHLDDKLPSFRDQIGVIHLSDGSVPIYVQKIPDGKGGREWKISNQTVAQIPKMWEELGYGPGTAFVRELLPDYYIIGMENWQILYLLLALVLSWPAASLICWGLNKLFVSRRGPFQDAIARFLKIQFRIFLAIMLVWYVVNNIGLSIKSQLILQSSGVIYLAVIILLQGIINLALGYQTRRMYQAGNAYYVSLLKPLATSVQVVMIIIVCLVWAKDSGFNVSTILAGLGVGSLAVALAAQKTLENVIGAITIYTARPIKPGDFCRFATTVGTVEEIGLRSTVIRTLNRTVVSIPNSVFASAEVENYSRRDRIRYFRNLRIEIGPAEQMQLMLTQLLQQFEEHERVQTDTVSICFDEINDNTAQIRIDAGIMTTDFQDYLQVAQDLNLRVIGIVQDAGGRFSGPAQQLTVHQAEAGEQNLEELERKLAVAQEQRSRPPGAYSGTDGAADEDY